MQQTHLSDLPIEVLNIILGSLDVSDLLQASRASHLLRTLSRDPLLQKIRLQHAQHDLNILLNHRLPKSSISPPNAWIYLSKTNVLSRSISKSLIKIRLNHSLSRRPSVHYLVDRAILPQCCSRIFTGVVSPVIVGKQEEVRKLRLKDRLGKLLERRPSIDRVVALNIMPVECSSKSIVSPGLVETRRRVIKESVKDGLRAWIKSTAIVEQKRQEQAYDNIGKGISVQAVVRRISARRTLSAANTGLTGDGLENTQSQVRWGRELEMQQRRAERRATAFGAYSQPTRAHVLGLRRFWEGVIKAAAG